VVSARSAAVNRTLPAGTARWAVIEVGVVKVGMVTLPDV
jgi:hypothetical protein